MFRPSDRRDSYRLHLDPGQAAVLAGGLPIELRDLSASGGRLIVRGPGRPELPPVEIRLGDAASVRTRLDVVRVRCHEPGVYHLGARFGGIGPEEIRTLSRFIASECQRRTSDLSRLLDPAHALTVKSPLFIRNLFRDLAAQSGEVGKLAIVDRQLRLGGQLRVETVAFEQGQRVIRARFVGSEMAALTPGQAYEFVLGGAASATVFESHCLEQTGAAVTLTLPAEVRQAGTRSSRRQSLTEGEPIRVDSRHPRLTGARLGGDLLDVGPRGLAFGVGAAEHGLVPGDRLRALQIGLPARGLAADAVVRSVSAREGSAGSSCGIELVGFGRPEDAELWRRFVFERMHPHLVDGNGVAESAWSLLEASSYIERWAPPAVRAKLRQDYLASWQSAKAEVGHSLLFLHGGRPVGISAASALAPGSWMLHHLACDPLADADGPSPLAKARELISGILHRLQGVAEIEHFAIFLEQGKRWNERLYTDFVARYQGGADGPANALELSPIEVYRRTTELPALTDIIPLDVVAANPRLMGVLAHRLREVTSPLERRALALDEEGLDLAAFSDTCRRNGYERGRHIFFAIGSDGPRAALIADSGGEGVNLFGLLNTCRLVSLGDPVGDEAAREALLRRAIAHYRDLGKHHFLLIEPGAAPDEVPGRLSFQRISGGLRWIAHRDVIPAWTAYLEHLLASPQRAPSNNPGEAS